MFPDDDSEPEVEVDSDVENDKEYTEMQEKRVWMKILVRRIVMMKILLPLIKSPNLPKGARRRILQPNLSNMPLLQILLSFVRSTERSVWRI